MPTELIIGITLIAVTLLIYLLGYLKGRSSGIEKGMKLAIKHLKETK